MAMVHSKMLVDVDGRLWGFQLWINLPKKHKMIKPTWDKPNWVQPAFIPVLPV
jgi:redox-sensitive bicupin YhaK (pirin superfamily)